MSEEKTPEAQEDVVVKELEEEVISSFTEEVDQLDIDSSDDEIDDIEELEIEENQLFNEEAGEVELSETKTVGGIEYYVSELDGQVILFSKSGEPVGVYDADTDTVQECEFDDE